MQDSAPIAGLSETSSDPDDNELELDDQGVVDISMAERLFVTGVLDELKVSFSYSYQVRPLVTDYWFCPVI